MESWKTLGTIGSYSPIFALSITAEEWGLKEFPPNLLGIEGTWTAPENTPGSPSSTPNQTILLAWNKDRHPRDNQIILNATEILQCERTTLPPWDTCYWIIEDIGHNITTVGPLHSDLVSLTCCLSTLLSIFLASLIMGCLVSIPERRRPQPDDGDDDLNRAINQNYNPPAPENPQPPSQRPSPSPRRNVGKIEQALVQSNTTRDIRRCTALLRELYSLDLEIWGSEGATFENPEEGKRRMAAMKKRASDIFDEVRRIVEALQLQSGSNAVAARVGDEEEIGLDDMTWTERERECLVEIFRIIEEQRGKRGNNV